jgi:hypothetical protein
MSVCKQSKNDGFFMLLGITVYKLYNGGQRA